MAEREITMDHYKEEDVPATTRKVRVKTTCDMCKKEIKEDPYEVDEVTIERRTGYSSRDGGSGKRIDVDMCGKCFDKKLLKWLKEQGVEIRVTDWDY